MVGVPVEKLITEIETVSFFWRVAVFFCCWLSVLRLQIMEICPTECRRVKFPRNVLGQTRLAQRVVLIIAVIVGDLRCDIQVGVSGK